MIAYETTQQQ